MLGQEITKINNKIQIGDRVWVLYHGATRELQIVDTPGSDPSAGRISYLSPLARAILDTTCPGRVMVQLPNGEISECAVLQLVR